MTASGLRPAGDVEVLIPEARRRARRRRLWSAAGVLTIAGIAVGVVIAVSSSTPPARHGGPASAAPAPSAPAAGGGRVSRTLEQPSALATGPRGTLFIADDARNMIFIRHRTGRITPFAGSGRVGSAGDGGTATSALLNEPAGMVYDPGNNSLYFADAGNDRVRAVGPNGMIRTVAGTGRAGWADTGTAALSANLSNPTAVALSPDGHLYIACDLEILRLDGSGKLTRVAGRKNSAGITGVGGPAVDASVDTPNGLAFDARGDLYLTGSATKGLFVISTDGRMRELCSTCLYPRGNAGIVTAPDGSVLVTNTQKLERITSLTTRRVVLNFNRMPSIHGVRVIVPTGVTVSGNGTIYIDTNESGGFTNATTLMSIKPAATHPTLLWKR